MANACTVFVHSQVSSLESCALFALVLPKYGADVSRHAFANGNFLLPLSSTKTSPMTSSTIFVPFA